MSTALVWSDFIDLSRNRSVARCERGIEKQVITANWKNFSAFYRLKALKFALPIQMFLYSFESSTARGLSLPWKSGYRLFINRMRALYWNIKQKHSLIFSLNFTQQLAAPWGDAKVYWLCSSSDWHNHSQLHPRCFERGRQFPGLSCRDSPSRHEVWVR